MCPTVAGQSLEKVLGRPTGKTGRTTVAPDVEHNRWFRSFDLPAGIGPGGLDLAEFNLARSRKGSQAFPKRGTPEPTTAQQPGPVEARDTESELAAARVPTFDPATLPVKPRPAGGEEESPKAALQIAAALLEHFLRAGACGHPPARVARRGDELHVYKGLTETSLQVVLLNIVAVLSEDRDWSIETSDGEILVRIEVP